MSSLRDPRGRATVRRDMARRIHRRRRYFPASESLESRIAPVAGLDSIGGHLTDLLNAYQNQLLQDRVYNVDLPVIGEALGSKSAFQFAGAFASSVETALASATTLNQVKSGLVTAFGSSGLTINVNDNGDPNVNNILTDAQFADAEKVEFFVVKTGSIASAPLPFDFGALKNLGLNISTGTVNVGLSYQLPLRFGIDGGKDGTNFFVDVSGPSELFVAPVVSFANLGLSGSLGALGVTVKDLGSNLTAPFHVDVDAPGGRLETDFGSLQATAGLSQNAAARLRLDVTAGGTSLAPSIKTILDVNWPLGDTNVNEGLLGDRPTVKFENISVSAGSVAQNLLAPYLGEVEKAIKPVKQLSDVLLDRPIDLLPFDYLDMIEFATRVDKDIKLPDLLKLFKREPSEIRKFLEKAKAVGDLIGRLHKTDGGAIPIGNFTVDTDIDLRQSALSMPSNLTGIRSGSAAKADPAFKDVQETLNRFGAGVSGTRIDAGIRVDLIEDTTNVVKLLVGDASAQLVSFDLGLNSSGQAPILSGGVSFTTAIGIVPIQFDARGELKVSALFNLGYDATGLVAYAQSKNGDDLVKGLYVGAGTHLSFVPEVTLSVTGGWTEDSILGLIRSYTGISVPKWVLELTGLKPELAVVGTVGLGVEVSFVMAGGAGEGNVRLDQLGGNVASVLTTTGKMTLDATAEFKYGIHVEVPGKKIWDAFGLSKLVGGLSFNASGTLDLMPKIKIVKDIFPSVSEGRNLRTPEPVPPTVSISVGGATLLDKDRDLWLIDEGELAKLNAAASATGNTNGFTYSWRQITAADMGGVIFATPSVKLSDEAAREPTFSAAKYSTVDNPDIPQGFFLVGYEDRYIFEVTVTDQDTGLFTKKRVYVVAQDVSPTVEPPQTVMSKINTGGVGVRGFDLGFGSTFTDPGVLENFSATWDFGDPSGVDNVVNVLQLGGGKDTDEPIKVGGFHRFVNAGEYTVGLTVRDGFTEESISKTLGTTLATSTVNIVPAAVLPDQADASKLALYIGGTNLSETIIVGFNPVTNKITVSMPDFSGEFDPTNVAHIYVNGQGGDDTIILDFSNGDFLPKSYERTIERYNAEADEFTPFTYTDDGGVVIDGGDGFNRYLAIGGNFHSVEAAFLPDENGVYQDGFVHYIPNPKLSGKMVSLIQVQSIHEFTNAQELLLAGNPDDDLFTIRDGAAVGSMATTEVLIGSAGERGNLSFANKALTTIAGGGGADTFILDNPNSATGLTKLVLDGQGIPSQDEAGNEAKDDGAADIFLIRATGADVEALGHGGDDVFDISSMAGINNRGNLDGIRGNVTIDAGSGDANLLTVIDYSASAGNPNVVMTDSMISGLAPGTIRFRATDGSFAKDVDGILVVGAFAWADHFNIRSTLATARTRVLGLGGDDVFFLSSTAPHPNGGLAGLVGELIIDGGYGHYIDDTPGSNLRGLYSFDTIIVEGDANFTLTDTRKRLADGSPIPDQTASEAVLSVDLAGNSAISVPDIQLISIEKAVLNGGPSGNRMDGSRFSGTLILNGGDGDDVLIGGSGHNELNAGGGDDLLIAGFDPLAIPGLGSQNQTVYRGGGANLLRGGSGRNTFQVDLNGTAILEGGEGENLYVIVNPATGLVDPVGGITVKGAGKAGDALRLEGGGGAGYNQSYLLGPIPGSGNIVTTNNRVFDGPTISQFVRFSGVARIEDSINANEMILLAESAAAPIGGVAGDDLAAGVLNPTVGGQPFGEIDFSNKSNPLVQLADGKLVTLPPPAPVAVAEAPAPVSPPTPAVAVPVSTPAPTPTPPLVSPAPIAAEAPATPAPVVLAPGRPGPLRPLAARSGLVRPGGPALRPTLATRPTPAVAPRFGFQPLAARPASAARFGPAARPLPKPLAARANLAARPLPQAVAPRFSPIAPRGPLALAMRA